MSLAFRNLEVYSIRLRLLPRSAMVIGNVKVGIKLSLAVAHHADASTGLTLFVDAEITTRQLLTTSPAFKHKLDKNGLS